jgi:hypothetical protein
VTPRTTPNGTGRDTGVLLAAVLLVLGCFGAMVVLHVVRADLNPIRQVMSEYANGRYGWFTTAAFYAMGLACVALAVRLGRAIERRRLSVAVRVLLGLGGLGLVLAGMFEVERPGVPDTIEEIIHSDATLTALTLIITAMLLFAVVCRRDPRCSDFRVTAAMLAIIAAVAGAFSRRTDHVERPRSARPRSPHRGMAAAVVCCTSASAACVAPRWSVVIRAPNTQRSTGGALSTRLRLVAIGLLLSSFAGLALLHVVRADLSPVSDRLSEYANGSYGAVMTVSFVTLGAGMVVLGLGMSSTGTMNGWNQLVPLAVIAAGCGMVVSGLYPTDPAGAPTTTERVHSLASGSATVALIAAAVTSSFRSLARRPRRAIRLPGVLACVAIVLGAVSPILHKTDWTGLSQRLLWLTLMGWLLVMAWQLARQPIADAAVGAVSGSLQDGTSERSDAT